MNPLRQLARKMPLLPQVIRTLRRSYRHFKLYGRKPEDVFTSIYKTNKWGGHASVSGRGSDVDQTRIITSEIPILLDALGVSTMLDIPCGDFHWMKGVSLNEINYIGADIVKDLIIRNNLDFASDNRQFAHLNLIQDELPSVDLIFCRDCLVHLSFADIGSALKNICMSQSEYFLTTTYPDKKSNKDIPTGEWRPLNLELAPFSFPKPIMTINEGCTEEGDTFKDKALCLWRISDIQACL